ncbi:hypothetical protein [Gordonia sputi]
MTQTVGVDQSGAVASGARQTDPYAADEHALIISGDQMHLPSGRMRRAAPTSPAQLRDLIGWAWSQRPPTVPHRLLQPRGGCPQVWIVGTDALEALGWLIDLPDGWDAMSPAERNRALAAAVERHLEAGALDAFLDDGWELRGKDPHPGPWIRLKRGSSMVDIILVVYAWAAEKSDRAGVLGIDPHADDPDDAVTDVDDELPDTSLSDDDALAGAELGRRLAACVQHLDVLPAQSSGRTGAAIADRIWNARRKSGKGVVIDTAGPIPDLEDGPGEHEDLEPPVSWTRHPDALDVDAEFTGATTLVELDQRRAYLGSTGIEFGYGTPTLISGDHAANVIADGWSQQRPKTPFALCRVWLPAGDEISVPDWLPLPHPLMRADRRRQAWVTTRSVHGLCAPVSSGGAGLDLDDLDIDQAWLWPHQGRVLDAWTKRLREAGRYFHTSGDIAMDQMVKACYAMYIGRMQRADLWTGTAVAHHHQPVWRAFVMADTRWRNRAHAMAIYNQHGLKPLQTTTDSWVYMLGPIADPEHPDREPLIPDLADHTDRNGKLKLEKTVDMVDPIFVPLVLSLLEATTSREVSDALTKAFNGEGLWD